MVVHRSLAQFLRRFCSTYYAYIRYTLSPVAPSEQLTRFLFEKDDIDRNTRVKYQPFFHAKGEPISTVRTNSMGDHCVWRFGDYWVAGPREKRIHARVDFRASNLEPLALYAKRTLWPPRHADLHGWPMEKEARRTRAKEL